MFEKVESHIFHEPQISISSEDSFGEPTLSLPSCPSSLKNKKEEKTAVPLIDPRIKNCFINIGPKIDLQNKKQDNTEVPLTDPKIKNCFVNIGPKIDSKKKKKNKSGQSNTDKIAYHIIEQISDLKENDILTVNRDRN